MTDKPFLWLHASLLQDNKPLKVMYPFIFKYVETLLKFKEDFCIREACNILKVSKLYNVICTQGNQTTHSKLTGSTLIMFEDHDDTKMQAVTKLIYNLAAEGSLSE